MSPTYNTYRVVVVHFCTARQVSSNEKSKSETRKLGLLAIQKSKQDSQAQQATKNVGVLDYTTS